MPLFCVSYTKPATIVVRAADSVEACNAADKAVGGADILDAREIDQAEVYDDVIDAGDFLDSP